MGHRRVCLAVAAEEKGRERRSRREEYDVRAVLVEEVSRCSCFGAAIHADAAKRGFAASFMRLAMVTNGDSEMSYDVRHLKIG